MGTQYYPPQSTPCSVAAAGTSRSMQGSIFEICPRRGYHRHTPIDAVLLYGDQTINGIKTFNDRINVGDPPIKLIGRNGSIGSIDIPTADRLRLGDSKQLQIYQASNNSSYITNNTVDNITSKLFINTLSNQGQIIVRLGSDDNKSSFKVLNNSGNMLFKISGDGIISSMTTVTTINNNSNTIINAAALVGKLILRDPSGASRTDTTDSAQNIIAAIIEPSIGNSWDFKIKNIADANEIIILSPGAGVTISGSTIIQQNKTNLFTVVITGSESITIYSLGSLNH